MPGLVQQTVTLPAPADVLFDMYLNPKAHAAFTGHPVMIGPKAGARFEAFDGMISGKILHVVPKRLIVQTWRSRIFHDDDIDSTLILTFWPADKSSGRIEMIHANVADHDVEDVSKGWPKHYWKPWRKYLKQKQGK